MREPVPQRKSLMLITDVYLQKQPIAGGDKIKYSQVCFNQCCQLAYFYAKFLKFGIF